MSHFYLDFVLPNDCCLSLRFFACTFGEKLTLFNWVISLQLKLMILFHEALLVEGKGNCYF